MPFGVNQDWLQRLFGGLGGETGMGDGGSSLNQFLQMLGIPMPTTALGSRSSRKSGGAGGIGSGGMQIGPPRLPITGAGTVGGAPYPRNPEWFYPNRPGGGIGAGGANTQLPYQALDPNSSEPAWKQLGFYRAWDWERLGRPTETGLSLPSLVDPATGIYHYERYTPEYEKAWLKALYSNYRPRQKRPPIIEPPVQHLP